MSLPLSTVTQFLKELAPLELAESWDNVGLILGDCESPVQSIMTCLTLTPDVAEEAIQKNANLIVSHHPILFRPVQKLTSHTAEGRMVLKLIQSGIAVYSPHTAYDSAKQGINQQLAEGLDLQEIRPLRPSALPEFSTVGAGRRGHLSTPVPLHQFVDQVRTFLKIDTLPVVGERNRIISSVAVACGAAGEFLTDALSHKCDAFLTGETRFHTCLDAREKEIALLLPGHYATERPGIEHLATLLKQQFPQLNIWSSSVERDPLSYGQQATPEGTP
ncbi:MAG TPA: Nif3-like dinuclear metal center hexameric protein [Planctomicrobium sp.]|nr:Nif3-like dinuclear metal center hexameric protein [Planctomicrobium sp.]